jgi:hypothetical protein
MKPIWIALTFMELVFGVLAAKYYQRNPCG